MIRLYLAVAAIGSALALGGWGVWYITDLRADKAALTASVAALKREAAVAEQVAAQAKEARAVADAEAERLRSKAKEYDKLKEFIMGNTENAPTPDLLRTYLDRLFSRDPD